jgi:aldehyde:ferredoxin oxidoreductase
MFGVREATQRLAHRGKGKLIRYCENWCAIIDSLEICKNLAENMELLPFDRAAAITNAATGLPFTKDMMYEIGERIVNLERAYVVREGITRKDDYLPARFLKEPLPNGNSKGSVFEIEPMLDEYYEERGWDANGVPKTDKLRETRLEFVIQDLKRSAIRTAKKKKVKNSISCTPLSKGNLRQY